MKSLIVTLLFLSTLAASAQVRMTTILRTDSIPTTPLSTTSASIWLTRSNPTIKVKVSAGNVYSFPTSFTVDSIKVALAGKMSLADVNAWWSGIKTSPTSQYFRNIQANYIGMSGIVGSTTLGIWGFAGLLGSGSTYARIHFNPLSGYTNAGRITLTAYHVGSAGLGTPITLTLSGGTQPGSPKAEGNGSWYLEKVLSYYNAGMIPSGTFTNTLGAGAGTGANVIVSGDNLSGTITITTGTFPSANQPVVTLAWTQSIASSPSVTLTPGNASAVGGQFYIDNSATTNSSFRVSTTGTLAGSTTYILNYSVHHHQ